jgi:hypothetical protein
MDANPFPEGTFAHELRELKLNLRALGWEVMLALHEGTAFTLAALMELALVIVLAVAPPC